jgi:hypothetical protein
MSDPRLCRQLADDSKGQAGDNLKNNSSTVFTKRGSIAPKMRKKKGGYQLLIQEGHHMSTALTDPSPQKAQQHQRNSAISYLSPAKAQQHQRRFMNKTIHDAANSPSSSKNNLLDSLVALKNRNFQNAPGSNLVLSYKGGLLGGAGGSNAAGSSLSMRIGTSNVIPVSGVDFMAPKQDKNEGETGLIKQRGLNYSSTHYVSEGAYAALSQLSLNPRQSDVYADLFNHNGEIQSFAKSQVDAAHEKLHGVLGNTSAQRPQESRHTHLAGAAIRASVVRDKLDTIGYYRGKVKYVVPKAVTAFWFADSAWAISVKFGPMPKEGPAEPVGGYGFTLSTASAQNLAPAHSLPLAFAASWAMGEVIKRGIDWYNPHYFTGLDNHRKDIARLAEDFLSNSKVASEARAGGTAAANLVRAYGESGRDFLEGLMNEVDRSAYDYMLALSKSGRPMPPDEHLAGTDVTSSALELTYARLEEARFIQTFTGRLQDDHAIVKYWQPGPAFSNLGVAKIAEDPLGQEMRHLSRVRNDNVAEGGANKLWDYTRALDETLGYLERGTREFSGILTNGKQIKQSLAASRKGDAKALFQLAKLSEQGALGIPKGVEAMAVAKQLYFPAAQQGDAEAQYRLGCLNSDEHGTGRPGLRDDPTAVKWLTLAADQNHPEAQARLGLLHAAGRTGLDDHEAAIHAQCYCKNAIDAGVRSPELLFTLASLYDQGFGQ